MLTVLGPRSPATSTARHRHHDHYHRRPTRRVRLVPSASSVILVWALIYVVADRKCAFHVEGKSTSSSLTLELTSSSATSTAGDEEGSAGGSIGDFFKRNAASIVDNVGSFLHSSVLQPLVRGLVDRVVVPRIREYIRRSNYTTINLGELFGAVSLQPIPGVGLVDCSISGLESIQREGDVNVRVKSVSPEVRVEADGKFRFHNLTAIAQLAGLGSNNLVSKAVVPRTVTIFLSALLNVKVAAELPTNQVFSMIFRVDGSEIDPSKILWKEVTVEDVTILPGGDLENEKIPLFSHALRTLAEQILKHYVVNKVVVSS